VIVRPIRMISKVCHSPNLRGSSGERQETVDAPSVVTRRLLDGVSLDLNLIAATARGLNRLSDDFLGEFVTTIVQISRRNALSSREQSSPFFRRRTGPPHSFAAVTLSRWAQ
jgi:hypothetical protein